MTNTLVFLLACASGLACSRQIDEEPDARVPEHRVESCDKWCSVIFDPVCPKEVDEASEDDCFDGCVVNETSNAWLPHPRDSACCTQARSCRRCSFLRRSLAMWHTVAR